MDAEKREKIVQEVMEFSLLKPGTNGYAVEESMLERLALRVERETLEEAARVAESRRVCLPLPKKTGDKIRNGTLDHLAYELRRIAKEVK